jgi:hypothetical protein
MNSVAESQKLAGLDGMASVSALGLRWAALRGMLNSPLILGEEQRGLRDELLHELNTVEQDFSVLQSRNPAEISAKVDIAKSALREKVQDSEMWMLDLLDSIQSDLQGLAAKSTNGVQPTRPPVNLSRTHQSRPDEATAPASQDNGTSSAA